MYGEIMIGEQKVPMLAMASTDIYYKRIFGEDPIRIQTNDNFDVSDSIELTMKMGYVMAKFAEVKDRKEMLKLSEDTYLDWLDTFNREDYVNALEDIRKIYEGQRVGGSTEKNVNGE